EYSEVRNLGGLLKQAARQPAFDATAEGATRFRAKLHELSPELAEEFAALTLRPVASAPTLVKYANPNQYDIASRTEVRQASRELMNGAAIEAAPLVDLLDDEPLEIELATTLLYEHCEYPYRQVREAMQSVSASRRAEIIQLGVRHRGKHDELARAY